MIRLDPKNTHKTHTHQKKEDQELLGPCTGSETIIQINLSDRIIFRTKHIVFLIDFIKLYIIINKRKENKK